MKREQAEQIARKHVDLRNKMEGHEDALSLSVAVDAIMEAAAIERADEREACAKPLDEAAARLLAPKRTNDVDRHVADVLQRHANAIRARGNE